LINVIIELLVIRNKVKTFQQLHRTFSGRSLTESLAIYGPANLV